MTFGEAIEQLKLGRKVKRSDDCFGYFYLDYIDYPRGRNYYLIYRESKDKILQGFDVLEANDLVANDWEILREV
jgi:hypothetical protein